MFGKQDEILKKFNKWMVQQSKCVFFLLWFCAMVVHGDWQQAPLVGDCQWVRGQDGNLKSTSASDPPSPLHGTWFICSVTLTDSLQAFIYICTYMLRYVHIYSIWLQSQFVLFVRRLCCFIRSEDAAESAGGWSVVFIFVFLFTLSSQVPFSLL